jgi:hypothetical protein
MGKFFTPPPTSVAELATIVMETLDGIANAKRDVSDVLTETVFKAAAYAMGVEINGEVTVDSIGLALGKKIKAQSGVDLGNILDGESVKDKIERVAIAAVLVELRVDAPASRDGLAEGMKAAIRRGIAEKIGTEEAAGLLDAVGSVAEVTAILAAIKRRDKPLKAGEFARKNRERQATYRSTHKRVRT